MRLQELGIMSGEVRSQIEDLQQSGAAGNEVWAVAARSFERFAGMMDERSRNLSGRLSNLSDVWTNLRAALGRPLSAIVKPIISAFTAILEVVTRLFERFPLLAGAIGVAAGAIGVFTLGAGALITAAAVLIGSLAALSFAMEWLAVRTTLANSRLLAFHGTNLLTSKGLLLTSRLLLGKVALAFKGLLSFVGGIGAAILGISAPVWGIIAVIAAAAAAVWYFWGPVKSFFTGFAEGVAAAMAPVRSAFEPLLVAGRWILSLFGSLIPARITASSAGAAALGRIIGLVFGNMVKLVLLPIRLFMLLGEGIGYVAAMLAGLISPLRVVSSLWGKIREFFGFAAPAEPSARLGRPAQRVSRVVAASALAAAPAFAAPAGVGSAPDPIVRAAPVGDGWQVSAPITVNVPPGADAYAVGREVERAVQAALRDAQRQQRAEKRRRLYG